MVTCAIQAIVAYFAEIIVLSSGLSLAITYLWSQKNRGNQVSFMFGFRFQVRKLGTTICGVQHYPLTSS
jgi:hypothetical protein